MRTTLLFYVSMAVLAAILLGPACGRQERGGKRETKAAATESASERITLTPGRSAGQINIGDADTAVRRHLGPPDLSDAAMGKAILVWHTKADDTIYPLSVFTARDMGNDETARIKQIRITSPQFETRNGLRPGVPLRELSIAYPHALHIVETYEAGGQQYSVYDTREGIAFEVDSADVCTAIIIQEKGDATRPYLALRQTASQ
jgi:hypothetical protein